MLSHLKFSKVISTKVSSANSATACQAACLYEPLCCSLLEYTNVLKSTCHQLELVQNMVVRFVKKIQWRHRVTTQIDVGLGLQTLEDSQRNHRITLLIRILSNSKGTSLALSSEYYHNHFRRRSPEPTSIYIYMSHSEHTITVFCLEVSVAWK